MWQNENSALKLKIFTAAVSILATEPKYVVFKLRQNSHSATLIFLIFYQLYLFFGNKSHIFILFVQFLYSNR